MALDTAIKRLGFEWCTLWLGATTNLAICTQLWRKSIAGRTDRVRVVRAQGIFGVADDGGLFALRRFVGGLVLRVAGTQHR